MARVSFNKTQQEAVKGSIKNPVKNKVLTPVLVPGIRGQLCSNVTQFVQNITINRSNFDVLVKGVLVIMCHIEPIRQELVVKMFN